MKETTKNILRRNDFVLTKEGLYGYLRENNKLPYFSSQYAKNKKHFMAMTVAELEKFI